MQRNKHCYTISFSFILLLVEEVHKDRCQQDYCLLPCSRDFWQTLCCKQVPTSTCLPRLTSWPEGITWHCYIWHRRRHHYSASTIRNMCPWLLSFSVFSVIYLHLCMWFIHIIQFQILLHNPNSQGKQLYWTIIADKIPQTKNWEQRVDFMDRLFCKTRWAFWKFIPERWT